MTKYRIKKIAFNRARTDIIKTRALSYGLSFSALCSFPVMLIILGQLFEKFGWVLRGLGFFQPTGINLRCLRSIRVWGFFCLLCLSVTSLCPNTTSSSATPGHSLLFLNSITSKLQPLVYVHKTKTHKMMKMVDKVNAELLFTTQELGRSCGKLIRN